ncbi:hypothetical protein AVEN_206333-1 [Araneus ventricosus]|uniref:Uncharacterized protein n=1 Tax=Araneus ventricosus TaxID=182803 RepID=A0A4Y2ALW7_ARAVE|nr:hypothetical protein AVEN_206333-1 [Araneus ventricosus]
MSGLWAMVLDDWVLALGLIGQTIWPNLMSQYGLISMHLSELRTNFFNTDWKESRPVHLSSSRQLFSHHSLKRILFQISVWSPDWVLNLGCRTVAPYFLLELLQQFSSFASSMGIAMQEDDTITQHARAFASDGFKMAE